MKGRPPLAFDHMQDRAISGTTDRMRYEVVLRRPKGATKLAYGALLTGMGQIRFDVLEFTDDGTASPMTDGEKEPTNVGFEK
ncbi:MAG: hypothetical protein IPK99_11845 [Flavobacteriales bacterium]|nr:hypothetical protein [Flavobacteriales bacterium]